MTNPTPIYADPACSGGSCQQGRAKCKTPQACQVPIDEENDAALIAKGIVITAVVAVALASLGALLADRWAWLVAFFSFGPW